MNKYSVFAISVILIIGCLSYFNLDSDDTESIIGFADDISSTDSGNIFYINDEKGNRIKAFYSEDVDDSLNIFIGNYSDDRNIFFVKNVEKY